MKQGLEDVFGLLELVVEVDDEEIFNEVVVEFDVLEEKLVQFEFCCMFFGEYDSVDCYFDIQVGFGGMEVQDWVSMFECMYLCWVELCGFKIEIIEELEGEVVGIKFVMIKIFGDYVYGWLCIEIGVYCLVCKSLFDFGGCCYMLFSFVFVYLEVDDDIDIEINLVDLCIDVYCMFGVGGQYVNCIEFVVCIIYILIGIVIQCQNDCFQYKNKDQVMKQMKVKFYELEMQKKNVEKQVMEDNKFDIGWGSQICFYVFDDFCIKDLCIGVEICNMQAVLDGSLD